MDNYRSMPTHPGDVQMDVLRAAGVPRSAPEFEAAAEATWADPDAFAATKAANQDDYGAGIVLFAEQWARLMEAAVARGETVASAWDRCSHLADTMGMSGFSASCAERMIRQWWIHRDQCPPPRWPLAPKAAGTVGAEGGVP